jgi:hypothetical protein
VNRKMMLDWLIGDARENADQQSIPKNDLDDMLWELLNRPETSFPILPDLPHDESRLTTTLQECLGNNVSRVSFVLHRRLPDKYLFYRVSDLEPEIFEGLDFLRPVMLELDLPFTSIGNGR